MKLLSCLQICFIILLFSTSCGKANSKANEAVNENDELEVVMYSESVVKNAGYLNNFKIDSINKNSDTIKYYFTDSHYNYFSDINVNQQIHFVFQEFFRLKKLEYNYIEIYYSYPNREESNEILVLESDIYNFIESLDYYKYDEFNKLLNELYILDSEYGQVNIIELLTTQLELSSAKIESRDPKIFGLNVNEFILDFIFSCATKKPGYQKILYTALQDLVESKTIYPGVADEIEVLFHKYCEEVIYNTLEKSI